MKKLLLAALAAFAFIGPANAQVVTAPAGTVAMVCANNTSVPTPSSGKFFYVQCDSSGKLITSGSSGGPATSLANPLTVAPTTAASSTCNTNSYATAFTCDMTKLVAAFGSNITGSTTLCPLGVCPTTGYVVNPNLATEYIYYSNSSGANFSTSGNAGRTNGAALYIKADALGQGDTTVLFGNVFVNGAKAGATNFLANPAGEIVGGQVIAGQAGVYLEPLGDMNCNDGGFDVACIGSVFNYTRTVNTGALGVVWLGDRRQCGGSVACDVAYSLSGLWNDGFDMSNVTLGANKAAITLPAAARIYTASTASGNFLVTVGTDYINSPAAGQFQFVMNSTDRLNYNMTTANSWAMNATLNMVAGNILIASNAVLGLRSSNTPISSPANAVVHLGTLDAAAPVAQTLGVQGVVAGTSNAAGALFSIVGSLGTGTGPSGNVQIQVGKTGTTGTVVNSAFPMVSANAGAATTATVQLGDGTNFTTYDSCTALTTGATGIIACTASDERLKKNIAAIDPSEALAFALNVPVKAYEFKNPTGGFADARRHIGMMAQDIKRFAPHIAETMVSQTNPTDLTPDGTWQVDYNDAGPIALAAIKKQQEQIDDLKRRIR